MKQRSRACPSSVWPTRALIALGALGLARQAPAQSPAPAPSPPPVPAPATPAAPAPATDSPTPGSAQPGSPIPGAPATAAGAPAAGAPAAYPAQAPGEYPPGAPGAYPAQAPGAYPPPGYPAPYPAPVEPPPPEAPWPVAPEPDYYRHKASLQTEAVFGADEGPFFNYLLGARYEFRTSGAVGLGGYAGYANLKGTGKRVHSALLLGQFEYRFYFGDEQRFFVPLRAGLGYLIKNGVTVRFATGTYFRVTDTLELGIDLITPMFWTASNDTVISMNLALEAGILF